MLGGIVFLVIMGIAFANILVWAGSSYRKEQAKTGRAPKLNDLVITASGEPAYYRGNAGEPGYVWIEYDTGHPEMVALSSLTLHKETSHA